MLAAIRLILEIDGQNAGTEGAHQSDDRKMIGVQLVALHGFQVVKIRDQRKIIGPFGTDDIPAEVEALDLGNFGRKSRSGLFPGWKSGVRHPFVEFHEDHVLEHFVLLLLSLMW